MILTIVVRDQMRPFAVHYRERNPSAKEEDERPIGPGMSLAPAAPSHIDRNTYFRRRPMQRTPSRRMQRAAAISAAIIPAGAALAGSLPTGELLVDPGWNSDAAPLSSFFPRVPGAWLVEDADIIIGSDAGIAPYEGDGMLRLNSTAGNASQVRQFVDVSSFASEIDQGTVVARFSVRTNAAVAETTPVFQIRSGALDDGVFSLTGGQVVDGYNRTRIDVATDADTASWHLIEGVAPIPSGTRTIFFGLNNSNSDIPSSGNFYDDASLTLEPCERLVDGGFDSGANPLQPYARFGNDPPWMPGEWNAENADIIVGSDAGVTPFFGDGMLRMMGSGTVSQTSQIIDVRPFASVIDAGAASARFFTWYNAAEPGAKARIFFRAGESQNDNGSLVPVGGDVIDGLNQTQIGRDADDDPAIWDAVGSTFTLPPGTRFLHYELRSPTDSIPPSGVYFDQSSVCVRPTLPSFGLPHIPLPNTSVDVADPGPGFEVSPVDSGETYGFQVNLPGGSGSGSGSGGPSGWGLESSEVAACLFQFFVPEGQLLFDAAGDYFEQELFGSNVLVIKADESPVSDPVRIAAYFGSVYNVDPTVQYQLLNDGSQVHIESVFSDPFSSPGFPPPEVPAPPIMVSPCAIVDEVMWREFIPVSGFTGGWQISFVEDIECTFPSGEKILGDTLRFFPPNQFEYTGDLSMVTVEFTGHPGIGFEGETVQNDNAFLQILGDASFSFPEGDVSISNIGDSGDDGVSLSPYDGAGLTNLGEQEEDLIAAIQTDLVPIDVDGDASTGSTLALDSIGFSEGAEQDIGTMTFTAGDAANTMISADFSPIGASTAIIEVFNQGSLVAEVMDFDLSGSFIEVTDPDAASVPWPGSVRAEGEPPPGPGCPYLGLDGVLWSQTVAIAIPGGPTVMGDELYITPTGGTVSIDSLSSVSLRASGIDSFTITNTDFETAPIPCPADLANNDGVVSAADLAALLGDWGGDGPADIDGDGAVGSSDLAALLGAWGPCP